LFAIQDRYGTSAGRNHTTFSQLKKVLTIGSALICGSFPFRCLLPQKSDAGKEIRRQNRKH